MIPFVLLAQTPTAGQLFNSAIAASKKQSSFAVEVTLETSGRLGASRRKYVVKGLRPDKAWVSMSWAGDKDTAPSERVYTLSGKKIVAWDVKAKQFLSRPVPGAYSTLYDGLVQGSGSLDEQARFLLDPPYYQKFLGLMRDSLKWSIRRDGSVVIANSTANKDINELRFDSSYRLVAMRSSAGLRASYKYLAAGSLGTTPPSGFSRVEVFRERPRPPRFGSDEAKRITDSAIAAHWNIRQAVYDAKMAGTSFKVHYDRGRVRSEGGGWRVVLTSNSAMAYSPSQKTAWSKKGSKTQILDFLKKRGAQVDGFALQLWKGVNPIIPSLTPTSTVYARGAMSYQGGMVDIVEIKRDRVATTLLIRRGDRMIAQSATEVDGDRVQRDVTWRSFNKGISSGTWTLSLPAGTKRL